MIKYTQIFFKGEMVRAILDGRKTMTRRVIKEPFEIHANGYLTRPQGNDRLCPYDCPYGKPGDRLWVRETWTEGYNQFPQDFLYRATYEGGADHKWSPSLFMPRKASRITLEVTDVRVERVQDISEKDAMAEGAMKLDLPPSVDAEWPPGSYGYAYHDDGKNTIWSTPESAFENLWDSINEKRGFGWEKNPWVWAVQFKEVQ